MTTMKISQLLALFLAFQRVEAFSLPPSAIARREMTGPWSAGRTASYHHDAQDRRHGHMRSSLSLAPLGSPDVIIPGTIFLSGVVATVMVNLKDAATDEATTPTVGTKESDTTAVVSNDISLVKTKEDPVKQEVVEVAKPVEEAEKPKPEPVESTSDKEKTIGELQRETADEEVAEESTVASIPAKEAEPTPVPSPAPTQPKAKSFDELRKEVARKVDDKTPEYHTLERSSSPSKAPTPAAQDDSEEASEEPKTFKGPGRKRRLVVRVLKKCIAPWRKWKNIQ